LSWIAVTAMLLACLAPSLSHALGSAAAAPWGDICTGQGSKWAAERTDGSSSEPTVGHTFEHCVLCAMPAPVLGLPPAAVQLPRLVKGLVEFPGALPAAPRTFQAWASARPRGPPPRA
jgi:Protein of unknown function (DUF2946)